MKAQIGDTLCLDYTNPEHNVRVGVEDTHGVNEINKVLASNPVGWYLMRDGVALGKPPAPVMVSIDSDILQCLIENSEELKHMKSFLIGRPRGDAELAALQQLILTAKLSLTDSLT